MPSLHRQRFVYFVTASLAAFALVAAVAVAGLLSWTRNSEAADGRSSAPSPDARHGSDDPQPAVAPVAPVVSALADPPVAAPATQPPGPATTKQSGPAAVTINRAVLCRDVELREPLDEDTVFHGGERVWAWASIANPGPASRVELVWRRGLEERARVGLEVGHSRRWRTWSRRTLRPNDVGTWEVDILDASGEPVRTLRFEVVPAP